MTKYYTPKLTKAQLFHLLAAMESYGIDLDNKVEDCFGDKSERNLHKRAETALIKAYGMQRKQHGKT